MEIENSLKESLILAGVWFILNVINPIYANVFLSFVVTFLVSAVMVLFYHYDKPQYSRSQGIAMKVFIIFFGLLFTLCFTQPAKSMPAGISETLILVEYFLACILFIVFEQIYSFILIFMEQEFYGT